MKCKYSERCLPIGSNFILMEEVVNQKTKVLVKCKCGIEYKISPQALFRNNYVKECNNCSSLKKIKGYEVIGGLRNHPAYNILDGIKRRCENKKHNKYIYYGGRGITVCDEWKKSFLSFCKWADENGYRKGLTIDRIDPNGNYEPSNCRFIEFCFQGENKHIQTNNTSGYSGVSFQKNINKWFSYYWYKRKRVNCGYYNSKEEAYLARETMLKKNNIKYKRINYE